MSKYKSLGSSPLGFQSNNGTMSFIPDLGVSKSKQKDPEPESTSEKKTVSYYLELDLIEKVKSMATKKDMCYSALVSNALHRWIVENG